MKTIGFINVSFKLTMARSDLYMIIRFYIDVGLVFKNILH